MRLSLLLLIGLSGVLLLTQDARCEEYDDYDDLKDLQDFKDLKDLKDFKDLKDYKDNSGAQEDNGKTLSAPKEDNCIIMMNILKRKSPKY